VATRLCSLIPDHPFKAASSAGTAAPAPGNNSERTAATLLALASRYRAGIVTGAVTLLAGFGITAVAVAPLVPDASRLPQRLVVEAVQPQGLDSQLEALASQQLTLNRSDITRSTDSAETLLARLGVRDASATAFLRSNSTARQLVSGRGGKMVQATVQADGSLGSLVARLPSTLADQAKTHFTRIDIQRVDDRWQVREQQRPYGSQMRLSSGTIRSTLFAATDEAGLPDAVAAQLAEIFSTDIDFHRQLRKGDTFSVVYEALTADGEPVAWNDGVGKVSAAEFVNAGKAYHAVWFGHTAPGTAAAPAAPLVTASSASTASKGAYFSLDGRSKRKAFLASPMEFSRVTSGFSMRFHPILQKWRQHLGVDYAAPVGTPVRSVGEGTVEFAGVQNGYGNVVEVKHGNERTTLYAHLSRIEVKKGQRVEQGHLLGAVGTTGWSTGPHLHFEFRVKGQHQDPLLVAKASESLVLDPSARGRFTELSQQLQAKLDVAQTLGPRTSRD
jgi:murein DD-endopeptidase MepM/ murein hydrolase activator NlpD